MVASRKDAEASRPRRRPATTIEGRENQMIDKAISLAERQLEDGSASSQVITHFLKLGSVREQLEREKLAAEITLNQAKIDNMASAARVEALYGEAITAMRTYSGQEVESEEFYED
jgi:hypothetical protein